MRIEEDLRTYVLYTICIESHAMKEQSTRFSIVDLFYWLLGGAIISVVIFLLFKISYELSGKVAISVLSAFSAGMSSVISILLVGIYIKQTDIIERHGQIMDRQADLMELQFIPDVSSLGPPTFENDSVEVSLENRGSGPATELKLLSRLEFRNSSDYDSPLTGESFFKRIEGNRSGEGYLASGDTGKFKADSILEAATLREEQRPRSFKNVISNLEDEVEEVRVSLFVKASGKGGEPQQSEILPDEAFYTDLEDDRNNTLQECYRVSMPA